MALSYGHLLMSDADHSQAAELRDLVIPAKAAPRIDSLRLSTELCDKAFSARLTTEQPPGLLV